MLTYIIRRILLMIPTLIGVSLVVFVLTQVTPGGPVDNAIRQMRMGSVESGAKATMINEDLRKQLEKQFGYDKPIHIRYINWMKNMVRLDFGNSYYYNESVLSIIVKKLPVSLSFGVWSFFLVYLLCIPLGIYKAIKDGTKSDTVSSILLFVAYSIPGFVLAELLLLFLGGGSFLSIFPIQGLASEYASELTIGGRILDYLWHLALPLTCYVAGAFATLTLLMKNSFLEQIQADYVRTAKSKGLSSKKIYLKHVLRNSLIPIATGLGGFLSIFFAGSLLLEKIFGLDGIGLLTFESYLSRDYPVVLALIMMQAVLSVIGTLISDILYVFLNPKIDFN